jgi:hypothetical protein
MKKPPLTELERKIAREQSFWIWFWERGLSSFWDRWLLLHLVLGIVLAVVLDGRLSDFAKVALLPVAAILVGLAFAWSGSIVALLQTTQLQRVGQQRGGQVSRTIVFTLQQAIFVILFTVVLWSLIAGGLVDGWAWRCAPLLRYIGRTVTFALSSIMLRECWQVTIAVQRGLMSFLQVSAAEQQNQQGQAPVNPAVPAQPDRARISGGRESTPRDGEHAEEEAEAVVTKASR